MTVPAYQRTWHQYLTGGTTPGVRAPYVSVIDAQQQALYQLSNFLLSSSGATTKFTCLWSASGGTGPTNSSDNTNRWTSSSAITPQGAATTSSQAYMVITDGNAKPAWVASTVYTQGQYVTNSGNIYICRGNINGTGLTGTSASSGGPTTTSASITDNTVLWQYLQAGTGACQILLASQGATVDRAKISISPGGLFTLAGTTNEQPTATDEQIIVANTVSLVGTTTSGDRILHFWASDDAKAWKCLVLSAGAMVSTLFGSENIQDGIITFPVNGSASVPSLPSDVWGFCWASTDLVTPNVTGAFSANTRGGLMRTLVAGTPYSVQVVPGIECVAQVTPDNVYTYQAELQGASGFPCYPMTCHTTNTVGSRGRLGNLLDWYVAGPSGVVLGDGYGPAYQWWQCTALLLPNPSAVAPTLT